MYYYLSFTGCDKQHVLLGGNEHDAVIGRLAATRHGCEKHDLCCSLFIEWISQLSLATFRDRLELQHTYRLPSIRSSQWSLSEQQHAHGRAHGKS